MPKKPFHLTYFCLDWEKLIKQPEHATIIRLMIALNDANCFPFLFSLTNEAASEYVELTNLVNGINSYLERLRMSHIAEAIKNTIRILKSKEKEIPRGVIWKLIKSSKVMRRHFKILEDYLPQRGSIPEGKYYDKIKPYLKIRNSVTFHYDHEPNKKTIDSLVNKHILGIKSFDKKNPARGLIVDGTDQTKQIGLFFRYLAADDLLKTHLRQELGIPARRSYASCRQTKTAVRHTKRFMASFQLFAWELIREYLKKHDLLLSMKVDSNKALVEQ